MAIPPYVAVAVAEKRRSWVARGAVASLIAVVAVVCVGLLVRERIYGSDEQGGSELAGQYYAVAKPPAFNFNRKLSIFLCFLSVLDKAMTPLGKTYMGTLLCCAW
jgi:hypothetical protein